MSKKLLEIAAEIVQAQASINRMSSDEIESVLGRTFNALHRMQKAEEEGRSFKDSEESAEKSLPTEPMNSIQENKVICLECGAEMRQLTANHLAVHGLSPREYKKKWGFPLRQPLSAKSLTRLRSKAAKKRGVPPELKAFQEERRRQKMGELEDLPQTEPNEEIMNTMEESEEIKGSKSKKQSKKKGSE